MRSSQRAGLRRQKLIAIPEPGVAMPHEPEEFEQEVRRLAREMWPNSGGESAINVDGRERDGVFITTETVHIIEATTNNKKSKAEHDIEKSIDLKKTLSRQVSLRNHNFKIWFITLRDPTPDQRAVADDLRKKARCPVQALSGKAFQRHLVDVGSYLTARSVYPFGSVRNLDTTAHAYDVPKDEFIPLDMVEPNSRESWGFGRLAESLESKRGFYLLLGDFGAGKSMTMRHTYFHLVDEYNNGRSQFPVYVNLRDHIGQSNPASAIYDHATRIGFANPETLVRAWRAGFIHLFLDGFDEMVSSRFRGGAHGLKAARGKAMELVRNFTREHPATLASIFLSGRQNYFDSEAERMAALGLSNKDSLVLTLSEFTSDQVQSYLRKLDIRSAFVPDWMPSRPLLVGYLARRQIIRKDSSLQKMSRSEGWDYLLDRICEREGEQIDALGGAYTTIRNFIDRLATRARQTSTGRGPIPLKDMTAIFETVVPATADDAAEQLLLRMAGLTPSSTEPHDAVVSTPVDQDDSREFIDEDLVDAARAGDVVRFVQNSYEEYLNNLFSSPDVIISMGELGVEVAAQKLERLGASSGSCSAALRVASDQLRASALAFDILRIMQILKLSLRGAEGKRRPIEIEGIDIGRFEMDDQSDVSGVVFRNCIIGELSFECSPSLVNTPKFVDCLIEECSGVAGPEDIPPGCIGEGTEIVHFRSAGDAAADLRTLPLSAPQRVLIVTLRKLFQQAGRGRKDSAFPRGLSDDERPYVSEVLSLLKSHYFAEPHKSSGQTIWIPNRAKRSEAFEIIRAPQITQIPIMTEVKKL